MPFEAFATLLGSHVFPVCNRFKLWDVQTWADSTGILFDKPRFAQPLYLVRRSVETGH